MKDFAGASELQEARNRVRRLYGLRRITLQQHDRAMELLSELEEVLSVEDPEEEAEHASEH